MSNLILKARVGSKAYGLDHEGSDDDYLGAWIAPIDDLLSLHWNPHRETKTWKDPDETYHEVGKLCRLAMRCNPTVTELLWVDDYIVQTPLGSKIIAIRESFLSRDFVKNAYGGYAKKQVERIVRRYAIGDQRSDDRVAKHARHTYRLMLQGIELLSTGKLNVRLSPGAAIVCKAVGRDAITSLTGFQDLFEYLDQQLQKAYDSTSLPDTPDLDIIDQTLLDIRHYQMDLS